MRMNFSRTPLRAAATIVIGGVLTLLACRQALADAAGAATDVGINAVSGEAVYQHVCQGCHMPGGAGAVGAAMIPRLAGNRKLQSSGYPVYVVLNGLGGMPWFNGEPGDPDRAGVLDDTQVANVVNYIRTHFGNAYADAVTPADVAAVRGPPPITEH
jgi:mono/diheme cytochrome c family protein